MGLRHYFGKAIMKLVREVQEAESTKVIREDDPYSFGTVHNHLQAESTALVAFRIANGYVVKYGSPGGPSTRLQYCPDFQAISEFLVSEQAKEALGLVPKLKKDPYAQSKVTAGQMHIGGSFTKP